MLIQHLERAVYTVAMDTSSTQMLEFPGISREHGISGGLMRLALVLIAMTSVALMVAASPAPALEKGLIDDRLEHSAVASQRAAIIH